MPILKTKFKTIQTLIFMGLALFVMAGCKTTDMMPFSVTDEEKFGNGPYINQLDFANKDWQGHIENADKMYLQVMMNNHGELEAPELKAYLQSVLDKIILAGPANAPKANIVLVNDITLAAFYKDSNDIFISISLLKHLKDESQLAFLLAHEYSHLVLQHQTINPLEVFSSYGLLALEFSMANFGGNGSEEILKQLMKGYVADTLIRSVGVSYWNRKEESEADHLGMDLMVLAGYDPYAAVRWLAILDEIEKSRQTEFNEDRNQLEKLLFSNETTEDLPKELQELQESLNNLGTIFKSHHDETLERTNSLSQYIYDNYSDIDADYDDHYVDRINSSTELDMALTLIELISKQEFGGKLNDYGADENGKMATPIADALEELKSLTPEIIKLQKELEEKNNDTLFGLVNLSTAEELEETARLQSELASLELRARLSKDYINHHLDIKVYDRLRKILGESDSDIREWPLYHYAQSLLKLHDTTKAQSNISNSDYAQYSSVFVKQIVKVQENYLKQFQQIQQLQSQRGIGFSLIQPKSNFKKPEFSLDNLIKPADIDFINFYRSLEPIYIHKDDKSGEEFPIYTGEIERQIFSYLSGLNDKESLDHLLKRSEAVGNNFGWPAFAMFSVTKRLNRDPNQSPFSSMYKASCILHFPQQTSKCNE